MRSEQDGMLLVRAELCERLAGLQSFAARLDYRDFAHSISSLRTTAATYGLEPVVRLTQALERTLAEEKARPGPGRATALYSLYLDRLRDAIGCRRTDDAVSEAMIASVSIRLDA